MKARLAGLLVSLVIASSAGGQTLRPTLETERRMLAPAKLAYLFNIAKFVEWPDAPSQVTLCLSSNSVLWRNAPEMSGRELGDGRRLVVARVAETLNCDILFHDAGDALRGEILDAGARRSILMVTDADRSLGGGFAIQLFLDSTSLRFAIDQAVLRDADYQVSSKLLRLARPPPELRP